MKHTGLMYDVFQEIILYITSFHMEYGSGIFTICILVDTWFEGVEPRGSNKNREYI